MKALISKSLGNVRTVVIGADVAGLSAALCLAARGARVRVLERKTDLFGPGAAADEEPIEFPWVFGRLFALADLRLTDFVRFEPINPLFRLVMPGGEFIDVTRNRQELASAIAEFSKDDGRRTAAFLDAGEALARIAEDCWMAEPLRPGRGPWRRMALNPRAAPLALASARRRGLNDRLLRRFETPIPAAIHAALAHRLGVCPVRSNPGVLGMLAALYFRGLWLPEGGRRALKLAMRRAATLQGARFQMEAEVERIETDGGRVRGVTGEGFRPVRADLVVSTIAGSATANLLQRQGAANRPTRPMKGFVERARVVWNFEWTGDRPSVLDSPRTVAASPDARAEAQQIDDWRVPAAAPQLRIEPIRNREGWLRVEADAPLPSPSWRWSEENQARARDAFAARLQALGVGRLEEAIANEEFIAPRADGRTSHIAASPQAWMRRLPNTWPEVEGLFFAGDGAHPGPAMSLRALAGALAAQAAAGD